MSTFDQFWSEYPRRVAKKAAVRAWNKIPVTSRAEVIIGAMRYARSVRGMEVRFVAHPATWLNGERWTDEVETAATEPAAWDAIRAAMGDTPELA